jgi:hypothetical protein
MFTKKEEMNVIFIVTGSTIPTCTFSDLGIPLYLSVSRASLGLVKPVLRGHLWDKEKLVL